MSSLEEIAAGIDNLVVEVRAWCRSQASLWQQLPYLALQANGRTEFSGRLSTCHNKGLWFLEVQSIDWNFICAVDCETGEIIDHVESERLKCRVLAPDSAIVLLLLQPEELDASKVIQFLKEKAGQEENPNLWRVSRGWPAERRRIAARLGLAPDRPFVRSSRSNAEVVG